MWTDGRVGFRRVTPASLRVVRTPRTRTSMGRPDEMVRVLQRLPDRQRLAIVLPYDDQLSEAETAEVTGIGVNGVRSQTSRGLDRLRELLDAGEDAR